MDTFDTLWESSRTNSWSFAYPTVLFIGVVSLLLLQRIRKAGIRRWLLLVAMVGFFLISIEAASWSIVEKWNLRREWARDHSDQVSDAQRRGMANRDGANLTVAPVLAGFATLPVYFIAGVIAEVLGIRRANWNLDVTDDMQGS